MLEEAPRLYVLAGEPEKAIETIETMGERFEIAYFDIARTTLDALGKKAKSSAEQTRMIKSWTLLWQKGLEQEDFTAALLGISKSLAALKKLGDAESHKKLMTVRTEVTEMKRLATAADKAMEQLEQDENDPAANLAIGKYLCFVKNDFAAGLPRLSKGRDPKLKQAADLELAELEKEESDSAMAVAQIWYDMAGTKPLQSKRMKQHAATWFENALASLDDLKKKEVEKRTKTRRKKRESDQTYHGKELEEANL